ncbi:hypothetical protein [Rhodopila sp.]|uniref:hypothetical protein n=1 Tax=Rhodopila sp. TaxID=2480087 RepID=UPI002BD71D88|nr:hypothetical protein [Rhodopila sp.]HVZ08765.1 hypothetical protein [Rhodopila sp.]
MYAVTFDRDTTALRARDHNASSRNAYDGMGKMPRGHGVDRRQGGVYFGDETVDPVRRVLAVQALARTYGWFPPSVRDIRTLRIEDNNDLMPAVAAVTS